MLLLIVCATALPIHVMSTGERCAGDSEVYASGMDEEAIDMADDDEPTDENERGWKRSRSPEYELTNVTVTQIEARSAWMIP
jgi:hypothetical protein